MKVRTMKQADKYGSVLILAVLVLFALMLGIVYKINKTNKTHLYTDKGASQTKQFGFMVPPSATKRSIVIINSRATASYYAANGSSITAYSQKIKNFADLVSSMGYKTRILPIEKLSTVKDDELLFVLDAQVLSEKNKNDILAFVKHGGSLFFNAMAGFRDEKGLFKAESFVHEITNLTLSPKGFASFKDQGLSVTVKILSAFSKYNNQDTIKGKLLHVALYDELPIYVTTPEDHSDIYASSYDQISPPILKDKKFSFNNNEAAVAWHGFLGKGKWVYTSLPSYAFYDIEKYRESYKKILAGMISFLSEKVLLQVYPYIDQKSAVFISEDTEYKFTNFKRFSDLSQEYKIPVTAFIVSSLAALPEHKEMMNSIKNNPYVEFASHSATHKKIVGESEEFIIKETKNSKITIDTFAAQPILGFRPPREELNLLMKKHLAEGGYSYVLGATDSHLYPHVDKDEAKLYYIPRHGTDDYSYLVNLDWDQSEIVKEIIKEANFVTQLNGIYTLSVHTHLFSYGSNIEIIRSFYEYLKAHPEFKPLSGRELIKRVKWYNALEYSSKIINDELVVTLKNNSSEDIPNLHFKLFKNPTVEIISGRASQNVNVKIDNTNDSIMIESLPANTTTTLYISTKE